MKLSKDSRLSLLRNIQIICGALVLVFFSIAFFEYLAAGMAINWGWLIACIPTAFLYFVAGNSLRHHGQ